MKKTNMWFLERFRGSGENGAAGGEGGDKAAKGPLYSNVLTPDKIPDFFIPPKLPAGPAEPEAHDNSEHVLCVGSLWGHRGCQSWCPS